MSVCSVMSWFRNEQSVLLRPKKPWMVLEPGPLLAKACRAMDLDNYNVLTVDEACRYWAGTLAYFHSIDTFKRCADDIAATLPWVILPYVPHHNVILSHFNLHEMLLLGYDKTLSLLAEKGYLLSYNPAYLPSHRQHRFMPVIAGKPGIDVVQNILRRAGIKGHSYLQYTEEEE